MPYLAVDEQKMKDNMELQQVVTADLDQVRMMVKELKAIKTVTDTLQEDVCSLMCLELPECTAWTYDLTLKLCKCLAFQEPFCRQELTIYSQILETGVR